MTNDWLMWSLIGAVAWCVTGVVIRIVHLALVLAMCVVFITYAVITDRSLK